jgi:hypothetical protein
MNPLCGPGRPGMSRGAPPPPKGRPQPGAARPNRPQPAKTNPLPIILGVMGVLLVVLLFVMMSKSDTKPVVEEAAAPPPPKAAPAKPVDVSGLERDGHKFCEEGLAIIRAQEANFTRELSDAERTKLKEDLRKGIDLIQKGMSYLSEANEKAGRTYQTTKYVEARKVAAMKYSELK